jgi:hypothetical protein
MELLRSASSILFRKLRTDACADRRVVGMDGNVKLEGGSACKEFPLRKFQAVDVFLEASSL